jgi:hypothetical protein
MLCDLAGVAARVIDQGKGPLSEYVVQQRGPLQLNIVTYRFGSRLS